MKTGIIKNTHDKSGTPSPVKEPLLKKIITVMIKKIYALTPFLILFLLLSLVAQCDKEGIPGNNENGGQTEVESQYVIRPLKEGSSNVSDKLMGFNVIYPHEKNAIWQDNKIAGYLKDVNVGFIR